MAHPAFMVEEFVRQFLHQWHCGFEPTLTFKAKPNGSISVNYDVTASLSSPRHMNQYFYQNSRSGTRSRRRRRIKRTPESPEEKTAAVEPSPTLFVNESNDVPTVSSNSSNSNMNVDSSAYSNHNSMDSVPLVTDDDPPFLPVSTISTSSVSSPKAVRDSVMLPHVFSSTARGTSTAPPETLSAKSHLNVPLQKTYERKCQECQKELETIDDFNWHYNTKYGREDCRILRSFL